ncbi:MAG TPA: hypothetical protein VFF39_05680, partial [Verrucomicrobiae bacterium]|nr:hypothetical protein [Verrucomicrobiae bacterium]
HDRAAAAFLAGSNLKGLPVELHLSTRPKSEVAYGLVSLPLPIEKGCSEDYARPLAGEGFKVGETQVEWKESPTAEDILGRRVVVDRNFVVFSQFLQSIERKTTPDILDRIGGYVDMRFAEQAQEIEEADRRDHSIKPGDVIRNEPVFVMALKRYLELEIDAWEKRF